MKKYVYDYPHPAVATDIAVFSLRHGQLQILLIKRGLEPFKDCWALPGGFLKEDETVEAGARRELEEETGVKDTRIHQFGIYSRPDRDPRQRVISIAYLACVRHDDTHPAAASDAAEAEWFDFGDLPPLAFDHADIIADARNALDSLLRDHPLVPRMIKPEFTLTELELATENVTGQSLDKRSFRRSLERLGWVEETEGLATGKHRPAQLYRLRGGL